MQQEQVIQGLVPLLSSQAGSCLTFANWEEAGVKAVSYRIADLLMKPGIAVLNSLTSIRHYYNWPGTVILDAMLSPPNREDIYSIRSHYDGGLIRIDVATLLALLIKLQPDKIIFPIGSAKFFNQYWQHLPESIRLYFHCSDSLPEGPANLGRYLVYEPQIPFSMLLLQIKSNQEPFYLKGDFDLAQMRQLASLNVFFESDKPAGDGLIGWVYSQDGLVNILESNQVDDHQPIDSCCQCKTCSQQFTRAYLHHLLQQTPLLAQRYLIQHNVYYCQNHLIPL